MNTSTGGLYFGSGIDTNGLKADAERIMREFKKIGAVAQSESSSMDGLFKNVLVGAAGALTLQGALSFRQKLIDIRGEFQKYEAILTNSLGSQKLASDSMKMLSDVASKTPFQLDSLTNSYVKLVNQGFKPSREEIIKLGDLASSTGKGFDQLAEALLDAQTGQFERLKEFGIKASASGDQVSFTFKGVTTEVKNSSQAIQAYMLSLGDMKGVKGAMEAISNTLVGQVSNLEDKITAMFNNIGASSEGLLSASISGASTLVDNYEEIAKIIGVLITTYGAYKAAVIVTTAVEAAATMATKGWTAAEILHFNAMKLAAAAQSLLNRTMLANPYIAVATALAGLISYLVIFRKETDEAARIQKEHLEIRQKYTDTLSDEKAKTEALVSTLNNESLSKKTRLAALEKLKKSSDGYLEGLSLENSKTAEGAKLLSEYNKEFERKIYLQANEEEKIKLIKEKRELEKQKSGLDKQISDLDSQKNNPALTQASSFAPASSADVVQTAINSKLNARTKLLEQQNAVTKQLSVLSKEEADLESQSISNSTKAVKGYESVGDKIKEVNSRIDQLKTERNNLAAGDTIGINAIDDQINALQKQKDKIDNAGKSGSSKDKQTFDELLDYKKKQYEEYYAWARGLGTASADTEFKSLIEGGKTYEDYLKKSIDSIESKKGAIDESDKQRLSSLKKYYSEILIEKAKVEMQTLQPKPAAQVSLSSDTTPGMTATEMVSNHEVQVISENSKHILEFSAKTLREYMKGVSQKIQLLKSEGKDVSQLEQYYNQAAAALENLSKPDILKSFEKWEQSFQKVTYFAGGLIDALRAVSKESGDTADDAAKAMSDVVDVASAAMQGFAQGGIIGAIAGLALSFMTKTFEKEKAARQELQQIADDRKKTQLEYNQLLLEQNELLEKAKTIFGDDPYGLANKSISTYLSSLSAAKIATDKLNNAKVQVGLSNGKPYYGDLLTFYPDLVEWESGKLNDSLAQLILDNQNLDAASREALQSALDYSKDYKDALASLEAYMTSLFGSLGSDMMTSITKNLNDTIGAIDYFSDYASKSIEKLMQDIAYSMFFADLFKNLSDQVTAVMTDNNLTDFEKAQQEMDLFGLFFNNLSLQTEEANKFLEQTRAYAASYGFGLWKNDPSTTNNAVSVNVVISMADAKKKLAEEIAKLSAMSFQVKMTASYGSSIDIEKIKEITKISDARLALESAISKNLISAADYNQAIKYIDAIEKGSADVQALQKEYNETITGTSVSSLSDEIASMFENGETSAAKFADTFNKLIKKALVSSLQLKSLDVPLQKWFDEFASYQASDSQLSPEEIANLRSSYESITANAAKMWADMDKLVGATTVTQGAASVGAFQSMSQDTGSALEGRFTSMQMTMIDSNNVLKTISPDVSSIRENASNIADAIREQRNIALESMNHLADINKNTKQLFITNEKLDKVIKNTDRL